MALEALDKKVSGRTKQNTRKSSKSKDEERAIDELPDTVAESAQLEGENDVKHKKDKRKRTKHAMDEAPTQVDEHSEVTVHTGEVSKKKKKSKRHQDEDKLAIDAGTGVSHASPEVSTDHMSAKEKDRTDKRKKRKEEMGDVKESENADDAEILKEKKKRKKDKEHVKASGGSVDIAEEEKGRKQKSKEAGASGEPEAVESTDNEKPKKKKKRRHSKYGFPDPEKDESLSDQANKALCYAYIHAEAPETWKFNKARQNWLVRNIWSDVAVPEQYVPIVNRYLSSLQGGAREALIKTCRDIVAATLADTEAETATSVPQPSASDLPKIPSAMKQQRAHDLLTVLTTTDTDDA